MPAVVSVPSASRPAAPCPPLPPTSYPPPPKNMFKREPQVKILVFPSTDIDRVAGDGTDEAFVVQDVFAGYLTQQVGETSEKIEDPKEFDSVHWQGQRAFDHIDDKLDFVRFQKDGTVKRGVPGLTEAEGMGGWTLKPVVKPLNCTLETARPADPKPDNKFENLQWKPVKGDAWETFVPAEPPYKTYIRHRMQVPDTALEIVSEKRKRATGLEVELIWNGVFAEHKKAPGVRLILIENKLSIVWRRAEKSNTKPVIERWKNDEKNSGWVVWKKLDDAAPVAFKGRTLVRVQCIAGMLVIDIDDKSYYLTQTQPQPGDNEATPKLEQMKMSRDPIRLSVFGVDVTVGISELEYHQAGGLARTVRSVSLRTPPTGELVEGVTSGWKPAGTAALVAGIRGKKSVTYALGIAADKKRELSPFISAVGIVFPGNTTNSFGNPIDVRPAAASMKLSSGEPGLVATSEVQLELSRNLLDEHIPDWRTLLKPFAPVRVLARWTYDETEIVEEGENEGETILTGNIVEDEWTRIFEGYVATFDQNTASFNDKSLSVVLRDPMMRLKAPAGFVDDRYGPLDFLYAAGDGQPLYDGDCVKYLLETEMGSRIASTINGNGESMMFSDLKYPMLSRETDRMGYFTFQRMSQPSTQSSFMLPPPFGRDVASWIQESIAEPMSAVFFWGHSPYATVSEHDPHAYNTPPLVPVYGKLFFYWATLGPPRELADAIYVDEDANNLFASVSVETLTDKLYNEVVVWGVKPKGTLTAMITPSAFGGRAALPSEHPNSADHSWRRVQPYQHDFIGKIADSNYASDLAFITLLPHYAIDMRSVTVLMPRGDETLRWGMVIKPKMQASGSDLTIGVNDRYFRISRINHSWDFTGQNPDRAFVTELVCRPA